MLVCPASAELRQFRKIIGYKHLAALAVAVERDIAAVAAEHGPFPLREEGAPLKRARRGDGPAVADLSPSVRRGLR